MLSGPAILRISVLMLIAGALAALVQFLLPVPPSEPTAEPPAAVRPAEPEPAPAAPPAPAPAPEPVPAPQAQPAPAPQRADAPTGPAQMPSDALAFPADPAAPGADPRAPAPSGEAEVARAEDATGPRALAIVDLNTASVAELNRLRGGGAIGRAIVAKRPYASVDQLLTKRVLSRAVYDRIREQVTVR